MKPPFPAGESPSEKFYYLCDMKKSYFLFMALGLLLSACRHDTDPLFGTWTVDKVNVQFDEQRNTPELVKQIGEMERQNTLSINADSVLVFKGLEETKEGKLSLRSDGTMLFDGTAFGTWKDGQIVTRTGSPLGEVVVTYRKE